MDQSHVLTRLSGIARKSAELQAEATRLIQDIRGEPEPPPDPLPDPPTKPQPFPVHGYVGEGRVCTKCGALPTDPVHVLGAPDPEPEPTRPPPDPEPPTRPPTRPTLSAAWDFTLKNGQRVRGGGEAVDGTLRAQAGPFSLAVVWDDFRGRIDPVPTVFLKNDQAGNGVLRWTKGTISCTSRGDLRFTVDMGANGCMPPRYALVRSALNLGDFEVDPDTQPIPAWLREKCRQESATGAPIGPYRFSTSDRDEHAPAGELIGMYNAGSRSWKLDCSEGRYWLWTHAVDDATRGLWLAKHDGSEWYPGDAADQYWYDASAREYAMEWQKSVDGRIGWGWVPATDGWCPYELQLTDEGTTDTQHSPRRDSSAFALAAWGLKAAMFIAREAAAECMRMYSMDKRVPPTTVVAGGDSSTHDDDGYSPLWQVLEQAGMAHCDRRDAHIIRGFAEAGTAGLLSVEEARIYLPACAKLLAKADDGRGVLDHGCQGDAGNATVMPGTPLHGKCPAAMFFQQALLCEAARWLGDACDKYGLAVAARTARTVAARIAKWWGSLPPYFAHTGGAFASATLAPHAGPEGHDYALWTHPGTWVGFGGADYKNFAGVLEASKTRTLGEMQLDCVPPADRTW